MVDGPDLAGVVRCVGMGGEVTAGTQYLDSVGSERFEVLAAGDQVYIDTRPTEARSYIRTDSTGTQHSNLHVELPSSATVHSVCSMEREHQDGTGRT